MEHLPFKSNTFDIIIFFYVEIFLVEPYKALKEVYRMLKDQGILLAATIPVISHARKLAYKNYMKQIVPVNNMLPWDFTKLLRETALNIGCYTTQFNNRNCQV